MATDQMYDLAFQYKAAKLWRALYDDEIFAVRLSDGETGYCNVLGVNGDHLALSLYVGPKGWLSLKKLADAVGHEMDEAEMGELLTAQDCLQCSFECKDMLSDRELDEVSRYALAREKKLRGRNAFPQFTKYRPGRYPWIFDSETDERRICEALSAAVELARLLKGHTKGEVGLRRLEESGREVPLFYREGEGWAVNLTKLPEVTEEYPEPVLKNDILGAKLRKAVKKGIWECGTMYLPEPIQEEDREDEAPYYPLVLIAMDEQSGFAMPPALENGERPEELVSSFASSMVENGCPRHIRAGDDRCFSLLRDLCAKARIVLTRENGLELLEEARKTLLTGMKEDWEDWEDGDDAQGYLEEICQILAAMGDGELRQIPPALMSQFLRMADEGALEEELAMRLRRLF